MRKTSCWCVPHPVHKLWRKSKTKPVHANPGKAFAKRNLVQTCEVARLLVWGWVLVWFFFDAVSLQLRKWGLGSGGVAGLASGTRAARWVEKPPEMLRKIHTSLSSQESGMSDQAGSCSNLSRDINMQIPGTSGRAASFALGHTPSSLTRNAL